MVQPRQCPDAKVKSPIRQYSNFRAEQEGVLVHVPRFFLYQRSSSVFCEKGYLPLAIMTAEIGK